MSNADFGTDIIMSVVEQPSYERENQGHVLQSGTPPITDACSHDSTFVSREQPSYERENQGHVLQGGTPPITDACSHDSTFGFQRSRTTFVTDVWLKWF